MKSSSADITTLYGLTIVSFDDLQVSVCLKSLTYSSTRRKFIPGQCP